MKWWHVAGIVAVLLLGVVLWSGTTNHVEVKPIETKEKNVDVYLVDQWGNKLDGNVWKEGEKYCGWKEGYLKNCAYERNGIVKIVLLPDPWRKKVKVKVNNCVLVSVAAVGEPHVGMKRCGENIELPPGKYEFLFFDENGVYAGRKVEVIKENRTIEGTGEETNVETAKIHVFDEGSGEETTFLATVKEENTMWTIEGYGKAEIGINECVWLLIWGNGYKRESVYICPGDEKNVSLPRETGGGEVRVKTEGAERIYIVDPDGAVVAVNVGKEAVFEHVPVGNYKIVAVKGAAVTVKEVFVKEGENNVEIHISTGEGEIRTKNYVEVFLYGDKIAEGEGKIGVPALVPLRVVLHGTRAKDKWIVLVPGEVRVI